MRNAISRKRETSVVASNTVSSKISASARNEIVVPFSVDSPTICIGALRDAAVELLAVDLRRRGETSTTSHSESAFTTETPTPCRPPETL